MLFFCRIVKPEGGFLTSLWTVNPDGTGLACQIPFDYKISHFAWQDPETIIVTTNILGRGVEFVSLTDRQRRIAPFGNGLFPHDGHFGFSPDYRWVILIRIRITPNERHGYTCTTWPRRQSPPSVSIIIQRILLATGAAICIHAGHPTGPWLALIRCMRGHDRST